MPASVCTHMVWFLQPQVVLLLQLHHVTPHACAAYQHVDLVVAAAAAAAIKGVTTAAASPELSLLPSRESFRACKQTYNEFVELFTLLESLTAWSRTAWCCVPCRAVCVCRPR